MSDTAGFAAEIVFIIIMTAGFVNVALALNDVASAIRAHGKKGDE